MEKQFSADTLEGEHRLSLRRLKFPPPLEAAFVADYYQKILPWMRKGLLLLLALVVLFWIRDYGSSRQVPLTIYAVPGTLILTVFLLTFHRCTGDYWQLIICLFGTAICLIALRNEALLTGATANVADAGHREDTFLVYECLVLICGLVLTRLWFVWLTAFGWATVLIGIQIAITMLGIPDDVVFARNAAILFPAMGILMYGGYVQERSARGEFLANYLLTRERARVESLLLNILPVNVAERLKTESGAIADSFAEVSVLFADIVDFTPLAARLSAEKVVGLLNAVFSTFDRLADRHGLEKIKTIGDAYMVVGGMPEPRADHVAAIAEMALEMQEAISQFERDNGEALRLRIGIHTGPVVAGVIGTRKFIYDLWGDTVNVASRMESHGIPGAIQVTESIYTCLSANYVFVEPRTISIKGRGNIQVYNLTGRKPPTLS